MSKQVPIYLRVVDRIIRTRHEKVSLRFSGKQEIPGAVTLSLAQNTVKSVDFAQSEGCDRFSSVRFVVYGNKGAEVVPGTMWFRKALSRPDTSGNMLFGFG